MRKAQEGAGGRGAAGGRGPADMRQNQFHLFGSISAGPQTNDDF